MASVRAATAQDAVTCAAIVTDLSDFFADDVPDKVRNDLRDHGGWVIDDAGGVVGFVIARWIAYGERRKNSSAISASIVGSSGSRSPVRTVASA